MNKQDKIKEAYGEYYEICKPDKNGNCLIISSGYPNVEWEYSGFGYNQPKSIQGIENNNGWIKIESNEDLPKEQMYCWFFDKEKGQMAGEFLNNGKDEINFILANATHYQPIIKPLKPLY